jgi:hypothetical protein
MDGIVIIMVTGTWITAVVAVGGVVLTWRKNGKAQRERDENMAMKQAERDTRLNSNQENIISRLDNPDTGLTALNEKIHKYALASTRHDEQIRAAERDIKELKRE